MKLTQIDKVLRRFVPGPAGAYETFRAIPQPGLVEWARDGTLDGVPVRIFYLLSEEDIEGGAFRGFSPAQIDRVEIDLCRCDLDRIPGDRIAQVLKTYG